MSIDAASTDALARLRLLQLASPALPVGAYSYSQGLEQAVAAGVAHDAESVQRWIGDTLVHSVATWEAPTVAAAMRAWIEGDDASVARLDVAFIAGRETAELRSETLQMGHSLARLLRDLPAFVDAGDYAPRLGRLRSPAYPTVWAAAAAAWRAPIDAAVEAYVWSWLENQVLAALKAMPLGQSAGQRLLSALAARVPEIGREAITRGEHEFDNWAPGLALASAAHEAQYSRLFRS